MIDDEIMSSGVRFQVGGRLASIYFSQESLPDRGFLRTVGLALLACVKPERTFFLDAFQGPVIKPHRISCYS